MPGEQRAGAPLGQQVPVDTPHGAFIAGGRRGEEPADDAVEDFNPAVDPWPAGLSAGTVDEDACLTIVESAYYDIGPAEVPQSKLCQDVHAAGAGTDPWIDGG